MLPIKKLSLAEEHVSRPIPMLSDRQYVVSSSKLTADEERSQRELFWYREELFKTVGGRWKEVSLFDMSSSRNRSRKQSGGTRTGSLSLRQQRMTLPMLEALRVETARVRMYLIQYDEEGEERHVPVDASGAKFLPPPNEFVYLRTTVTNLSRESLHDMDCPFLANIS